MRIITSIVRVPGSLGEYFDTDYSPLNSRNRGHQYSYGTLPLLLARSAGEYLDRRCGEAGSATGHGSQPIPLSLIGVDCEGGPFASSRSVLVGRAISALADVITVLLVFLTARQLYGSAVGLLAAVLATLTAFLIQQAHFFTVDSLTTMFTMAAVLFAVRAGMSGKWWEFMLAGVATGLAAASKVSGAYAALLVALAAAWRLVRHPRERSLRGLVALGGRILLAGVVSVAVFRIAEPHAFQGPGVLGVQLDPTWLSRLNQIGAEQRGELDFPSGRQWTGRTAIAFPLLNIIVWGMGVPLGIASLAGWALAGIELLKSRYEHIILWSWSTIAFIYLATRWVKTMRYFMPLYPMLGILAAYAVVAMARRVARKVGAPTGKWIAQGLIGLTIVAVGLWAWAVFSVYLRPHTRVASSRWVYENVEAGATIANEHWDWGIPLRIDGRDPFAETYRGLEMAHYDEDTPEKLERLLGWLEQADYLVTASNRLYASIPRIPERYPLTTEYYRALFAGELGFELAADFSSYPALGPIQFPDDENPFALVAADYSSQAGSASLRLPAAEEAFSVYDHPRVLIFRKTADFSVERAADLLGAVDLSQVATGLSPQAATRAPDGLKFDADTWSDQQAGGTWSEMFDRTSLLNRHPGIGAAAWWLVVTVLGWMVFPLLYSVTPRLRDRGYGFAKAVGMLAVAYLTWASASLRILPNTRSTIVGMCAVIGLAGAGVGWRNRRQIGRFVAREWRALVLMETVFVVLYVGWIGVRLLNPDLWHAVVGGEKPMDFAYLNAVIKSTWFPPYNPWLSEYYINYYYFGFVFVGTLIKLMGTVPSIAYNLAVPLLFALTGVGAYSLAHNLHGRGKRGAVLAGVCALLIMLLLGNLGVVRLIRQILIQAGGDQASSTIPGLPTMAAMARGLWRIAVEGTQVSIRPETWYWYPTRIIPVDQGGVVPITEFPAFTFLYADLHAHMIALPLTLVALAVALDWARSPRVGLAGIVLGGLVIGALRPTNTWDYPTFLVLGMAGLALGVYRYRRSLRISLSDLGAIIWRVVALLGLTYLLFYPYIMHYAGGQSVGVWRGSRTPADIYLWIHGIALFPVATFMIVDARRALVKRATWPRLAWWLAGALVVAAISVGLALLGYQVALVALPLLVGAAVLFLRPGWPTNRRLMWLVVGSAAALSLVVETVVLKGDIGRMNTVFKFYLQVWTFLGIAAGVALALLVPRSRPWPKLVRVAGATAMAVLIAGGGLFLVYGIRARASDRMVADMPVTLDGAAFMTEGHIRDGNPGREAAEISLAGDAAAIRWMQDNVEGSPVVLEGLGHREYLWSNRISIYTGLPNVVGWRWHQVQQRPSLPTTTIDRRRIDVNACYETGQPDVAREILDRYGVKYVVVGAYERAYYSPEGLAKFEQMARRGELSVAYSGSGVTIYEVLGRDDRA